MYKYISNYIPSHKDEILNKWIQKMKEEGDERVSKVVSIKSILKQALNL